MNFTPTFHEFFAGGGMVRAGLGRGWACRFANDFDHKKAWVYQQNWGLGELRTADIKTLTSNDIPGEADLAWASFPCQDLSLAGGGAGLRGDRSGTFWPFWNLIQGLLVERRAPSLVVLENVCGTITSHHGKDFAAICGAIEQAGYRVGAIVADAEMFVPQSRPRLFVIATLDLALPEHLVARGPVSPWHTKTLQRAQASLPPKTREAWIWWNLPQPSERNVGLSDLIEEEYDAPNWFTPEETQHLLGMMSEINRRKVEEAKRQGRRVVGAVYKRTRFSGSGRRIQRAEIRFDGISGCLRTPAGGSSRQVIVVVDGKSVRARLISSRETARLMGLPDAYRLPENYNEAYHLTGDGVVVPVVRHLARHILEPVLNANKSRTAVA